MKVYTTAINDLQSALTKLEDRIILTSDKNMAEREYAISELRYHQKLLSSFLGYSQDLQVDIVLDLIAILGEIEKWLNE